MYGPTSTYPTYKIKTEAKTPKAKIFQRYWVEESRNSENILAKNRYLYRSRHPLTLDHTNTVLTTAFRLWPEVSAPSAAVTGNVGPSIWTTCSALALRKYRFAKIFASGREVSSSDTSQTPVMSDARMPVSLSSKNLNTLSKQSCSLVYRCEMKKMDAVDRCGKVEELPQGNNGWGQT